MCECLAISRALPVRGPRSIVGGVLSACNSDMLNPGPRAWVAFAADNGDIKFPYRLPVMPETQEVLVFGGRHSAACGDNSLELVWDMQAGLAAAAGYFGGYTSKMQDIGLKELQRMHGTLLRKLEGESSSERNSHEAWKYYSKHLVRDLEGKEIVRTGTVTESGLTC